MYNFDKKKFNIRENIHVEDSFFFVLEGDRGKP